MKQTWRWFGPSDPVCIDDMMQAGVEGVVSALHHIPNGEVWSPAEIETHQRIIGLMKDGKPSGLRWDVVESLAVSEDIKTQKGAWRQHIENYKTSLTHLAKAGIEVVCYNFMPVLDWTRTDLNWHLPHGATCMRFDIVDFAAFDLFILARPGAAATYPSALIEQATERYAKMTQQARGTLLHNIISGLPGSSGTYTLAELRAHLNEYNAIGADHLRTHFIDFLSEVTPHAQKLGVRLCCHPDDPPFDLLGLPRIMSTETDYRRMMQAVDLPANGITLCTGSLGARADNDLPGIMQRLGERVHFLHLRNVKRDSDEIPCSFHETEHLGGQTNMVKVISAVLAEEKRRKNAGRADWSIPFRPDHGQNILDDLHRKGRPGYPAIGRLKGLAELRGIYAALSQVTSP